MRSWTTRFLIISPLLLAGCAPLQTPVQSKSSTPADLECIRKFVPEFKSQWYRSTVDVRGRHFSGLFLFKTMPDSTLRVVFTNEAGVKFFDYEFSKTGSFRIVESIKPLKRKVVSNVLRKDLALATLLKVRTGVVPGVSANAQSKIYTLGIKDDVNRFTIDNNCSQLTRAERYDDDAVKARVTFYGSPAVPDSIFVSHVDFDMDIRLRLLKKE